MKKFVFAVATVFAVAAVVAGGVAASGDGGTVVASGFACGILDGNGNTFTTTNSELIAYQTRAVLHCSGDGAPAASLTYFNFGNTGITCGMLQYGSTTDWVDKVGRSGNSQLTCITSIGPAGAASAGAGIG